ncbi:unnamed protein product [Lactuca saligna]|uniref:Uncharacterized protein n=1 Tax=Lactuca saligna TaxID=75948 RepID=A0AA35ZK12_LACSI|nr:unnamed protein product [Lactuca saligna]
MLPSLYVSLPFFPIPTTQLFTTIPIHTPIFTNTTTTTTGAQSTAPTPPITTKPPITTEPSPTSKLLSPTQSTEISPILGGEELEFDSTYFTPYRVQSDDDDDDDDPVTKHHLKEAAAAKNAQTVNASVENLQRSLQSERSNLEAAQQAIEAANGSLHANVNDRLTQLEAELAVENRIMDELDRHTSQLKCKTSSYVLLLLSSMISSQRRRLFGVKWLMFTPSSFILLKHMIQSSQLPPYVIWLINLGQHWSSLVVSRVFR